MMKRVLILAALLYPIVAFSFGFKAEEVFVEGTHWEGFYESLQQNLRYNYDYFIEGETEMLGEKCYKMWSNNVNYSTPKLEMLVRAEGDKVYFVTSPDAEQWSLLYDFSVALFAPCKVQYVMPWGTDSYPYAFELRCMQWFDVYDVDPGYELMFLQKFDDNFTPEGYAGQWIRGFGNVGFPTQNILGVEGDMRSRLARAYNGEKVFYENKTVSVDYLKDNELSIEQVGRHLNISGLVTGQPIQITSINGNVIYHNQVFADTFDIDLPDSGIFVVCTAGKATKIVVP